ncbi:SusC/RagA family TonB-linked outer membrane protein [Rhodohalobacter barkolensis]|uniref:SusC/RagA family TonB-linked outer membrane protein n=1 Tax=Rhodohalobacter barkolensis TaxID=2053187 RepID=A0A2N0VKY5_9BACT|nr:TonB-dependent receptor [Rhodohalobacter barkolensis]PKD44863.1 SusC/RagA family TonB-linked outer membrane protein [Rhodohalobacter barkolensis]
MKIKISSLLVLLIFLFGVSSIGAKQTEQYVSSADITSLQKPDIKVSLEETLEKIENNFDVIFLYQSNLVNGKFGFEETLDGSVFEVIERVLKPHDLVSTYLDNRTFVISGLEKPDMEIPADSVLGVVTDASTNQTLPGVNILVKGTVDRGTTTDFDGRYVLRSVEPEDTLRFSYIGYQTLEVPVDGRSEINVSLEPSVLESGEEIVVVGYGSKKRSEITGSVSSVSSETIAQTPILRVEQALQGRTAGVFVANQSGQPGEAPTIRIRGAGTTGSADPLYVVDGMPVSGIDYLNPGSIQSIEVLKDASSAAIYGARAANGVVLISTKSGRPDETNVTYEGYAGVQNPWKKINVLDARQYMMMMNEGAAAAGITMPFPTNPEVSGGTDWQEAVFNDNAPMTNHQITISGGNERTQYLTGFTIFSQEGIIGGDKSQFGRNTFSLKLNNRVSDVFRVGNSLNFTRINRNAVLSNSEWGSPLSNSLNMDPLTPIYESDPDRLSTFPSHAVQNDGRVFGISRYVTQEIVNPLARLEVTHGETQVDKLVNNFFAEYDLLPNLVVKSSFGIDAAFVKDDNYVPTYYLNSSQSNSESLVSKAENRWYTWNLENTITYQQDFRNHNIELLGGISAQKVQFEDLFGAKSNLLMQSPSNAWLNVASDEESMRASGGAYSERLLSYFGRVDYNFSDRYLLTTVLRVDGSSKFGSNNRYAVFPSISLGWIMSNESFMDDYDSINLLKLRASWGQNGNQNIGNFAYTSTIATGFGYTFGDEESFTTGAVPSSVPNPNLKWETSEQLNFGVDLGLWQDRLIVKADYYQKDTKGLLVRAPIPGHVGNNAPIINGGSVTNEGFEFSVDYRNYRNEFNYNVGLNFALNKNEVTHIGNAEGVIVGTGFATYGIVTRAEEGFPIGYFWGYETDGIFQTQDEVNSYTNGEGDLIQPQARPGDVRFADLNGDGRIDDADRTMIGNPTPDLTFGMNFGANYKQFEMSVFMQGTLGNEIFNATRRHDLTTTNMPASYLERWTGPGTSNDLPRFTWNDSNGNWSKISDLYVEDGSYLRVKNVQLGYFIPNNILQGINLQQAKIYVSAENLFTVTGYSGFDPEIGSASALSVGVDRGVYPQARSYRIGVNITF